jgi:hypothetical protein
VILVFLEKSFPLIGGTEVKKEIYDALESSRRLIVLDRNIDNVLSIWVEAE